MRSPNGPMFKKYEIAAVIAFAIGAITLATLHVVY